MIPCQVDRLNADFLCPVEIGRVAVEKLAAFAGEERGDLAFGICPLHLRRRTALGDNVGILCHLTGEHRLLTPALGKHTVRGSIGKVVVHCEELRRSRVRFQAHQIEMPGVFTEGTPFLFAQADGIAVTVKIGNAIHFVSSVMLCADQNAFSIYSMREFSAVCPASV